VSCDGEVYIGKL